MIVLDSKNRLFKAVFESSVGGRGEAMKFQLVINMERMSANADMEDVAQHTLEMVQMADAAGFKRSDSARHQAV